MAKIKNFPNIQRYREAKDITVTQMAKKIGVSVDNYEKLEAGKCDLYSDILGQISDVLDVKEYKLIYPARELKNVRFRSNKKLRDRELIILEVEYWLNEYNFIEELLEERKSNPLDEISKNIDNKKNSPAEIARETREQFGLSADGAISNICGLLESNGIKVGENLVESYDYFGLSVSSDDGGPAVVVNKWSEIPVERWIFTAAHEFGHLVLHQTDFNVNQLKEGKVHEDEANAFASEFLMPDASFIKEWNENYGLPFVERVITVKRIFRVSYKTILYRLAKLFPDSKNIWARFYSDYNKAEGKPLLKNVEPEALVKDAFGASFPEHNTKAEPVQLSPADFNNGRLISLVRKALEKKQIGFGRGAEILQISTQELRDLANTWYC